MPDDPSQTGKPDDARISLNEDYEVAYWAKRLEVSPDELRQIVNRVGPMVADVKKVLSR